MQLLPCRYFCIFKIEMLYTLTGGNRFQRRVFFCIHVKGFVSQVCFVENFIEFLTYNGGSIYPLMLDIVVDILRDCQPNGVRDRNIRRLTSMSSQSTDALYYLCRTTCFTDQEFF